MHASSTTMCTDLMEEGTLTHSISLSCVVPSFSAARGIGTGTRATNVFTAHPEKSPLRPIYNRGATAEFESPALR
eukprot:TCALIF_03052-PB protein Name:"Protein of unknown function" AED:0.06 eAED:0.09 QI:0/0.8/0.83/1/0.6/0.33/6/2045/74